MKSDRSLRQYYIMGKSNFILVDKTGEGDLKLIFNQMLLKNLLLSQYSILKNLV